MNTIFENRKITDLKDMLNQSSELFKDNKIFNIKNKDNSYTEIKYSEFKNDVDALGTALLNLDLKNKFIAIISENRYEWCTTYLGTVCGVGIIVPIDKELPIKEKENLLKRSNSSAVIFSSKYLKEILEMKKLLPNIKHFINIDLENSEDEIVSYKELLKNGKSLIASNDLSFINQKINAEILNILLFTSGTTDLAKGVMLSHKNICTNLMSVNSFIKISPTDSVLSILPLHHTYECTCGFLAMIYNGASISFNESLKSIGKNLKDVKPTLLFLVPLIVENMYKKIWDKVSKKKSLKIKLKIALFISNFLYNTFSIDLRKKLFTTIIENLGGKIRFVFVGAAAINPVVSKGLRCMGIPILQGYGLTEASPLVSANRENHYKDDSIGLSIPNVEIVIDNINNDGFGEIIVKGDNVMLGYFNNIDATHEIIKNNWLYTGDIGYMDSEGFLYITGRQKNIILTKNGKNVFPEEVETYLNNSKFISESLVFGKNDQNSNEIQINAVIVIDIDSIKAFLKCEEPFDEEINKLISTEIKLINKKMPLYKNIRKFKIRKEQLITTTTKKIKRNSENLN